jgi:hypothetical protein
MRRRGLGRSGRPSLVGAVARTAVVAGTASAVAGSVTARQQARAPREPDFQGSPRQHIAADANPDVRSDAGAATERMITQLTQLASLRDQGVLTNDEFDQQKARLLA